MYRLKHLLTFVFLLIFIFSCSHVNKSQPVEEQPAPETSPTPSLEEPGDEGLPQEEPSSNEQSNQEETEQLEQQREGVTKKASSSTSTERPGLSKPDTSMEVVEDEEGFRYYNFPDLDQHPPTGAEFQFEFEDLDIRTLILDICKRLRKNAILHPQVTGTITIHTSEPTPADKVWDVLMSILEMNHISVVKSGSYWKFVPSSEIQFRPTTTTIGRRADKIYPQDKMIAHIAPLHYINPSEAINLLGQLKSRDGNIIPYENGKLLIMMDYASSIQRLLKILELIDVDTSLNEIDIIQLEYADAADVKSTLDAIFSAKVSISGLLSQSAPPPSRKGRRRSPKGVTMSPSTGAGLVTGPLVFTDSRSNSLIVFGHKADIDFIHKVVDLLDINIYKNLKTYIYYVENAKATDMANILNTVFGQQSQLQQSSSQSSRSKRTSRGRRRIPTRRQPQRSPNISLSSSRKTGEGVGTLVEGEVQITPDERTNALIITTIPSNWPIIEDIVKKLDITPKQVLIEVLIAEISLDDSTKYGIEWTLKSQDSVVVGGKRYYLDSMTTQNMGLGQPSADDPSGGGLGLTWNVYEASRFMALLNAYAQNSKLKIISSPHILVTNNVEATINIGEQVPIITSLSTDTTSLSRFNTVQYQDTGVILTVTPIINEDRVVNLDIQQEVSTAQSNTVANIESPIIQTRKVTTTVVVRDKHTLVIGGMIQNRATLSSEGLPWFYKIPLIGKLFGSTSKASGTTELVIMITPHVVSNTEEADHQTQIFNQKIEDLKTFIERTRRKKRKHIRMETSSD